MDEISDIKWFQKFEWSDNPFKIQPDPDHIVGFLDMRTKILTYIYSRDPFMVVGPTGAGKTTLLKWIQNYKGNGIYVNFLGGIDEKELKRQISGGFWSRFLGFFAGKKKKIILVDEAQEMPYRISKWLRAKFDEGEIFSLVFASINENLENIEHPFKDRIGGRIIRVRKLTEEEAFKIVRQRIFSQGRHNPFTDNALRRIFEVSDYSPRKILENCETCCISAVNEKIEYINKDFVEKILGRLPTKTIKIEKPRNDSAIKLSPVQHRIIKILSEGKSTTSDIAKKIGASRASIAKQLSRLALKTDKKLLMKKGITSPLVRTIGSGRPVFYELTEEGKKFL
ncbi:MAG: AAA family ATPase [Candidatus Aenigmarchaeota archaeon]|nr:AAA family ATPase [Candidatus Aenigmarchaeota archaeon]